MSIKERERRQLQEALVNTLGSEAADTMMGYLPPVGWADVATKADLEHHAAATKANLESLETRTNTKIDTAVSTLRAELHHELRQQLMHLTTIMVALLGIFTAIIKLT